jgi:hypothetical protein
MMYDGFSMIYVYGFLTLFFLVDVGLMMLSNPTHIRSKGALHRNPDIEGEGWKHTCHNLLAHPSWLEL